VVEVDSRTEIRDFLISRRAKVTPERAGLPAYGGHRRVAGLRREEVALLAGVSVDYYVRLERGNLSGVSDGVLEALERALQLDEAERSHLFAADALGKLADEADISLIEMAIAFVLRHPPVTSAIIGQRTLQHLESQLAAADVALPDEILERIDDIVAPGITLNPAGNGWFSPSLQPSARRR
jgi:transcriptional regulator with XRE-family HTH domain